MAFLRPDKTVMLNGVTVNQFFLINHNDNKISLPRFRSLELVGVTVHNTPAITAAFGTTQSEQYTRATYNGNMGSVVVHFYVDENEAWQLLPLNMESWHAGSAGESDKNGSHLGNKATISVEVIGNSKKAEDNAARLIAYLMDDYGLVNDQLYTHNYWVNIRRGKIAGKGEDLRTKPDGYKGCPVYIIPHWGDFTAQVQSYRKSQTQNAKLYYVQVGAFSDLENAKTFNTYVSRIYPNAFVKTVDNKYYVQVGAFSSKDNAEKFLQNVKKDYKDAFIKTF